MFLKKFVLFFNHYCAVSSQKIALTNSHQQSKELSLKHSLYLDHSLQPTNYTRRNPFHYPKPTLPSLPRTNSSSVSAPLHTSILDNPSRPNRSTMQRSARKQSTPISKSTHSLCAKTISLLRILALFPLMRPCFLFLYEKRSIAFSKFGVYILFSECIIVVFTNV